MRKKIVLGNEYDVALHSNLVEVLKSEGAQTVSVASGVAGSQDCEFWVMELAGKQLRVESETYIGLSIEGEIELVEKLATMIISRRG